MKEALQYLKSIKFQAPDFYCDIGGGSDGPTATNQEVPREPGASLLPNFKTSEYSLPPLLSHRVATEHIQPITFWHPLTHLQTKTNKPSKVNDMTDHTGLDWKIEED